ncbi:hypothetical protein BDE02_15G015700 [Populus trichocarpa]|nr:hypothetical protein BDE02_15G015700 [Populus trichocarpa]
MDFDDYRYMGEELACSKKLWKGFIHASKIVEPLTLSADVCNMDSLLLLLLLLIIIISFQVQTGTAQTSHLCAPSSCGNIRNVSSPFWLKGDPPSCGYFFYELA